MRGLLIGFIPGGALGTPGITVGSGLTLGPGIGGRILGTSSGIRFLIQIGSGIGVLMPVGSAIMILNGGGGRMGPTGRGRLIKWPLLKGRPGPGPSGGGGGGWPRGALGSG